VNPRSHRCTIAGASSRIPRRIYSIGLGGVQELEGDLFYDWSAYLIQKQSNTCNEYCVCDGGHRPKRRGRQFLYQQLLMQTPRGRS